MKGLAAATIAFAAHFHSLNDEGGYPKKSLP